VKAVLYGRVSSDRQAGGESKSVDDQLQSLRKWAANEGYQVVGEFRDDGISASRYARVRTRPDWVQVVELITSGGVDVLAVWSIARATRDRSTWAALIAACIDNGVLIAVDGKIQDPNDPDESFMLDIQAALAVNGSARISKDAKRAVDSRAERGAPHGRVPDGYMIETDRTGKPVRRVVDPERGPIYREAVDRLLAGESAYAIARDFNQRGLKTQRGAHWTGSNIVNRIRGPHLAGLRVHHGQVLQGIQAEWPPIISVEEHHRLIALLADPARKSNKEGRTLKHLGTGIYLCGVCGGKIRMFGGPTRKKSYGCRDRQCVSRQVAETDAKVEMVIVEFLSRPDIYLYLAETSGEADVAQAREEAAKIRAELVEAQALVDSGELSIASFARFEKRLLAKLEAAEESARPTHIPSVVYDVARPEGDENGFSEVQQRWDATSITGKRAILRALVEVRIMKADQRNQNLPFDPSKVVVTPKA
jgi:site-specific DNA recombinase